MPCINKKNCYINSLDHNGNYDIYIIRRDNYYVENKSKILANVEGGLSLKNSVYEHFSQDTDANFLFCILNIFVQKLPVVLISPIS